MFSSRVLVVPALVAVLLAGAPAPAQAEGDARALAEALARASSSTATRLGVDLAVDARPEAVLATAVTAGAALAHDLRPLHHLSLFVPRAAVAAVTETLSRRPDVIRVATETIRQAAQTPNDSLYGGQSAYLSAIAIPTAWDTTHGSATVKVAVIDTGVDVDHPDLVGKVAAAHNSMATSPSTTDVTDASGHGTHVAGIVAAVTGNGAGVAGAGFDTSVLAVKAGDTGGFSDDDIAAGLIWAADNGAAVINLSLGGPTTSPVLSNAVSYAQARGALVVAAAGNDGATQPSYPAALAEVIAVGSTDAAGGRSTFSNSGSWVSVAAPGEGIWSTVPTAGSAIFPAPTSGYAQSDGTSMASPLVAAEAALLFAASPSATAAQVRSAIVSSAHGYSGLGLGTGQVDAAVALTKLPPATTPTLTSPVAASLVGGEVSLAASSGSSSVSFFVNGAKVAGPVNTGSGVAQAAWPSWGTLDGPVDITAADCNAYGCGPVSPVVRVTIQNPAPTISSPSDGTQVQGLVPLTVTTTDAAPKVRVSVDGTPIGAAVAVSDHTVQVPWPTGGYANSAHTVSVAACTAAGACGSSSSVSLTVANEAPVLTSPKAGQLVSGSFTLSATAASGALAFLVDGTQVGIDTTSPYSVALNFSAVADGSHTLTVQPCVAGTTLCQGPALTQTISVRSLHPSITKAAPTAFSPNADGRADATTLTYVLPDTEKVWWGVKNGSGTVVRGPHYLGSLVKGTYSFVWNGKANDGTRAPNGVYSVFVTTKATVGTSTLSGQATRGVRLDTVAPTLAVSGLVSGFYPYTDGYRDTMTVKGTVNEPGLLTLTVRNSAGTAVRTIAVSHLGTGTFPLSWSGRYSTGALVPAGTYKLVLTAQDPALNRRSSATYSVVVSLKKLVGTTVSTVITPAASRTALVVGECSEIRASSDWSGGYEYISNAYCYDPYSSTADLVGSHHQLTLPSAVKYAGISVAATGQALLSGFPDIAYAWYRDVLGDGVGGATLGSSYGSRSLGTASTSWLYGGRTVRWTVATNDSNYYVIRSFTVRYTYYVLK